MSSTPEGRSGDMVRIHENRADNTETVSSPHTYAYAGGAGSSKTVPSTTQPDHPRISNMSISSAMAGLPPTHFLQPTKTSASASPAVASYGKLMQTVAKDLGANGFATTTRRVETLSFDMDHVSPPIANLFRRIITTEVATLAFDRIMIEENDGVVLDELLSHRLGLCPVAGPVAKMSFITASSQAGFTNLDPTRVLVFELEAEGQRDVPITPVYSGQLRWVPLPGQEQFSPANEECPEEDAVFVVHPDILLTKLGPGQKLKLRAIAVKGIGAVHTKWSPVSSCFYEMRTSIRLAEPITGDAAKRLVKACPMGVFAIDKEGSGAAKVVDVSQCTLCRECLRKDAYPEFAEHVRVEKDKTSVRFHLESTGQMYAAYIFRTALTLFAERVRQLAQTVQSTEVRIMDPAMKQF